MEQQAKNIHRNFGAGIILKHKGKIAVGILLPCMAVLLLRGDSRAFLLWWLAILVMGCTFMPITGMLFSGFRDKGWMFSKVLAVALSGYITWLLVTLGILKFTTVTCVGVTLLCMGINFCLAFWQKQKGSSVFPVSEGNLIFWEEVLLFVVFLLWTYEAGFRPQAFGQEKFMDFGFMAAMMRSAKLPFTDIWYSQSHVNYYYGGQYYAVFLTKITGTQIAVTYHLMRTLVAGMAFVLPFSLVRQAAEDYFEKKFQLTAARHEGAKANQINIANEPNKANGSNEINESNEINRSNKINGLNEANEINKTNEANSLSAGGRWARGRWKRLPVWAGLLSGMAVSIAGNMHYVIYAIILPLFRTPENEYWFPNSTRYIGHDPLTNDQTIHEFPSYSYIQGDLHAHVVNVFFVMAVLGLLYAWMKRGKYKGKEIFLQAPLLVCGIFLGIFQWSNAWDFAIYYVVICGVCFFSNLARFQNWKEGITASVVQWVELLALSLLVALPFTLKFDSGMAQGICFTKNHSAFYQFCILWALPILVVIFYLVKICLENGKRAPLRWLGHTLTTDIYIAVLCLCALGLIMMPEIVYLKDIYEKTAARSNTMFKLTYQAFILFGISMGFVLIRFLADKACLWIRAIGILGSVCLLMTCGYTATAVKQWTGGIWNHGNYQGLDATTFLETEYPGDAKAIRWMQSEVEGNPVILEAPGDSYSNYCRVSAMTGLPTVQGWYVHEWLWRGNTLALNWQKQMIDAVYTSVDEAQVRGVLEKYQVSYIFIGQMEWERYPNLNLELLRGLGEVVFDDGAMVVRVD